MIENNNTNIIQSIEKFETNEYRIETWKRGDNKIYFITDLFSYANRKIVVVHALKDNVFQFDVVFIHVLEENINKLFNYFFDEYDGKYKEVISEADLKFVLNSLDNNNYGIISNEQYYTFLVKSNVISPSLPSLLVNSKDIKTDTTLNKNIIDFEKGIYGNYQKSVLKSDDKNNNVNDMSYESDKLLEYAEIILKSLKDKSGMDSDSEYEGLLFLDPVYSRNAKKIVDLNVDKKIRMKKLDQKIIDFICKHYFNNYEIDVPFDVFLRNIVETINHLKNDIYVLYGKSVKDSDALRYIYEIYFIVDNYKKLNEAKKVILEVAPPGKKAERFIMKNKEAFKKRYGKRWEPVLYATAWKMFGKEK